jgi:hypothetical protein
MTAIAHHPSGAGEPVLTEYQCYYNVEMAAGEDGCSHCGAGKMWAIVYVEHGQTEKTEIGQTFGDRELAEDICDLMNTAYESGLECVEPYSTLLADAKRMAEFGDINADMEDDGVGWKQWYADTSNLLAVPDGSGDANG